MRISFRRALPVLAGALCLAAALALFALRQGAPKAAVPGSALRSANRRCGPRAQRAAPMPLLFPPPKTACTTP